SARCKARSRQCPAAPPASFATPCAGGAWPGHRLCFASLRTLGFPEVPWFAAPSGSLFCLHCRVRHAYHTHALLHFTGAVSICAGGGCAMSRRAQRCASTRGFTLVELLVVIGIIALLIAILFPTLRRAGSAARRIRCMANQRQLVTAWHLYAREFRGYIPLAYPDGGVSRVNAAIDIQFIPWVIGDKRESAAPAYLPKGVAAHTDDWLLKAGSIYRYLREVRVYRCPE